MRENIFVKKYPCLGGALAGDIHDGDGEDDAALARDMRQDLDLLSRIRFFKGIIADTDRLLEENLEWELVANIGNRVLESEAAVREWLISMRAAWRDELHRLERISKE